MNIPMGRWVSELRYEFEPPLTMPNHASTPTITAFDLTPIANVPGIREKRQQLLEEFVWDVLVKVGPTL